MTKESREVLREMLRGGLGRLLTDRERAALQDAIDTVPAFEPLRVEPATAGSEE